MRFELWVAFMLLVCTVFEGFGMVIGSENENRRVLGLATCILALFAAIGVWGVIP